MSDMSVYLGDKLLDWLAGLDMPSAPAAVYMAIFNGDPEGAGTEVTGTVNLTRQAVTWGAKAARAMANSAEVNFGTANGAATATYVALMDAATVGNVLSKKSIASAAISDGEKVAIAIGSLSASY